MVPPEFADDGAVTTKGTQQNATAGGNDGTIDSTTLTTAKSGRPGHDTSTRDAATGVLSGNERVFAAIAADPTAPPWAAEFAAVVLDGDRCGILETSYLRSMVMMNMKRVRCKLC